MANGEPAFFNLISVIFWDFHNYDVSMACLTFNVFELFLNLFENEY